MPQPTDVKPARERILDAAASVMRQQGVVHATTKAIAAEAGYSEAMLYKHFSDKQELFLSVLSERTPSLRNLIAPPDDRDLLESVADLVVHLVDYFLDLFPMSLSIFSSPGLLAQHREGVIRHGGSGPVAPVQAVQSYLDAERARGRLRSDADTVVAAQLLAGIAFHQAFIAHYSGSTHLDDARQLSLSAARTVVSALRSTPA